MWQFQSVKILFKKEKKSTRCLFLVTERVFSSAAVSEGAAPSTWEAAVLGAGVIGAPSEPGAGAAFSPVIWLQDVLSFSCLSAPHAAYEE